MTAQIPWLEECREEAVDFLKWGMADTDVTISPDRLLALIAIAEAAQIYSAPEFKPLIEAVEAAGRVG